MAVVGGTIETLRVTGVPSGYPAEQESNVKVRWVDNVLEIMSDLEVPLLGAIGGINQFSGNNTKFEWVLGDAWADRKPLGSSLDNSQTTLTWDDSVSHRFPRGTVLKIDDELLWIQVQASTTTSTVVRGYAGTTAAAHDNGAVVRATGFAEVEGTSIIMRGSALRSVPFNHFSIYKTGSSESWMQSEAQIYTRSGGSMSEMMADTLAQFMVLMEAQVIEGERYEGSAVNDPPMSGGLQYFATTGNGATVIDAGGAKLSRAHFNTAFDGSFNAVGTAKMARTVLCGVGAQRVLYEEFTQPIQRAGLGIDTPREGFTSLMNEYGEFTFLGPFKRIPVDRLYIVNTALIEVGTFGSLGRMHQFDLVTDGDFNAMGVYGAYGNKFKGLPGIVVIKNFTV